MQNHQIDNLDKMILNALSEDARIPYSELGKRFKVSPATIYVRIEKMRTAGIIAGTKLAIDPKSIGYDVCCFIGITLKSANDYYSVVDALLKFDEIVEAHFTTGKYTIFIKIFCRSMDDLQRVLIDKIQSIDKIRSTETLISLQTPIQRAIKI